MFKNLDPSLRKAMYVVLLAFVLLISATFYTVRLTFKHFEPVMDKDYYETGLNYEKAIADQKELTALGYKIKTNWDDLTFLPKNPIEIKAELQLHNEVVESSQGTVFIERNATTREAKTIPLQQDKTSPLSWSSMVLFPSPGSWNVILKLSIQEKTITKELKVIVK